MDGADPAIQEIPTLESRGFLTCRFMGRALSRLIWVVIINDLLLAPLITTLEPPSSTVGSSRLGVQCLGAQGFLLRLHKSRITKTGQTCALQCCRGIGLGLRV